MSTLSRKILTAAFLLQGLFVAAQENNFLLLDPLAAPSNNFNYLRATINPAFIKAHQVRQLHLVNQDKDGTSEYDSTVMHFRSDGNIDSLWWYGHLATVYEYNGEQLARSIKIENGKHTDTCTYIYTGKHCTEQVYCRNFLGHSCSSTKFYWTDDRPQAKYEEYKEQLKWTCDSLGRVTLETDNSRGYAQTTTFTYDAKGRWNGGSDYTISYDDQGRFSQYEYTKNGYFDRTKLSYDGNGLPVLMEKAARVRTSDFADPNRSKKTVIRCVK